MLEHTKISSQKLYKKIIAIDLDGTILDSSERHNVVMRKVLDLYNINLLHLKNAVLYLLMMFYLYYQNLNTNHIYQS